MNFTLRITFVTLTSITAYCQEGGDRFAHLGEFNLEATTLGKIQNKLGSTTLVEKGDAGDYEAVICYRTKGAFVTFHSGEMGGKDNGLLGFSVRRDVKDITHTKVPKAKVPVPVTVAGLHLGMTKGDFERVIAKDVKWTGNVGLATFQWKVQLTQTDIDRSELAQAELKRVNGPLFFDCNVSVTGTFLSNKLVAFQVWKVSSF